jgi:hypothetical protein
MTEQQLDGAQIGTGLQQMNGEGMPQGMWPDWFADTAPLAHFPASTIDAKRADRLAWPTTRKQPLAGMGALPIVSQHLEEFGRQHDIAVFPAFALFDPYDHALAVDRGWLEADRFGNP